MLSKIIVFGKFFWSNFRTLKQCQKVKSFQQLNLPDKILQHLKQFHTLFEIQSKSMKKLLEGQDIIGIGPTGSGKTLAYAIPALIKTAQLYQKQKEGSGPYAIIICPSRELSIQITNTIRPFANQFNLKVANLYGGAQRRSQFFRAQASQIIVATPGRLKDYLFSESNISFENVKYLTLDEADKLLSLEFEENIKQIINKCPEERQTVMFSATWQNQMQSIAQDYVKRDAYFIQIGNNNRSLNPNIQHKFLLTTQEQAKKQIISIFESQHYKKAIIFCNKKTQVQQIAIQLNKRIKKRVVFLTSELSQNERIGVLNCFKKTPNCILVSTDVASRGIDIKDIDLVINYGFPNVTTDFIHRIGRTGRGGKLGKSITYIFQICKRIHQGLQSISSLYVNENISVPQSLENIIKQIETQLQFNFSYQQVNLKRPQLTDDQIEKKFKKQTLSNNQQKQQHKQTKNN